MVLDLSPEFATHLFPFAGLGTLPLRSLAVEEHYYLFWPLLVMRLDRDRLLKVIGLAIGFTAYKNLLAHYEPFYFTLSRLDGLAMGSGLAILARTEPTGIARFARPARLILLGLGLLLIGTELMVSGKSIALVQVVKSSLIAAVYASLILLTLVAGVPAVFSNLLSGRVLGSNIGKYSYGMYVLHPFILGGLHDLGLRYSVPGLLISVLATYLCAWLSWILFEKHFLKMKRYFEYSKRPGVLLESAAGAAGDGVSSQFGSPQHAAIPASRA